MPLPPILRPTGVVASSIRNRSSILRDQIAIAIDERHFRHRAPAAPVEPGTAKLFVVVHSSVPFLSLYYDLVV
jgi:hypothetical protein